MRLWDGDVQEFCHPPSALLPVPRSFPPSFSPGGGGLVLFCDRRRLRIVFGITASSWGDTDDGDCLARGARGREIAGVGYPTRRQGPVPGAADHPRIASRRGEENV